MNQNERRTRNAELDNLAYCDLVEDTDRDY